MKQENTDGQEYIKEGTSVNIWRQNNGFTDEGWKVIYEITLNKNIKASHIEKKKNPA